MATEILPASFIDGEPAEPAARADGSRRPALLRRLFDAFAESQMRRARREIAHAIEMRGLTMKPLHFTPPQD